ncbi:hypothetical protein CHU32_26615 [Superficieibacter electus]|uniref:Uncharacterized protein n=1 Tax=Superficieibacter electus TaxID=2022662 RepID=A0A2P5GH40_9ENTR|nr:hypothetical protein CHU33_26700 [Superficieibacter electus]POP41542.1 hypothetical protein CHU32_26615 [Superficieibacter electus]
MIFICSALPFGGNAKCHVCPASRAEAGAKHPVKNIPEVFIWAMEMTLQAKENICIFVFSE